MYLARRISLACTALSLLTGTAISQTVKVVGHRGASTLAPENTLASFQKAIDLGVDYLELDVWNSLDDSLMVIHDNSLTRTTNGTGIVTAQTYSQLRRYSAGAWFAPEFTAERIPTLREVLTLAKANNSKAAVEIKNTNETTKLVNLVAAMEMNSSVTIACFYISALGEAKKLYPDLHILYYVDPVTQSAIDTLKSLGGGIIGSGSGNTQAMIDYAHQQGIEFWPWTIDSTADMKKFMAMNVDAIITNYPQVLIPLVRPTGVQDGKACTAPDRFSVANFPNPFNASTTIRYSVSVTTPVTIAVYNLLGQEIITLMRDRLHPPGEYSFVWEERNLSSGAYIVQMKTRSRAVGTLAVMTK